MATDPDADTINMSERAASAFLTSRQLAARWQVSEKFLENKRWRGGGCTYLQLGRIIRYARAEVERYESDRSRTSTTNRE